MQCMEVKKSFQWVPLKVYLVEKSNELSRTRIKIGVLDNIYIYILYIIMAFADY